MLDFILIILTIALLVKSSDYFVEYSSNIAKKLGISEFVIGFTLVAFGTSFPELVSSTFAIIADKSGIVIGNILGSNVANIGLILGIGAILITIDVKKKTLRQDGTVLLISTLLFIAFLYTDSKITMTEGIIMTMLFLMYTLYMLGLKKKNFAHLVGKSLQIFSYTKIKKKLQKINDNHDGNILSDFFFTFLSGVGIYFGAKYTVELAIKIAEQIGVPEYFIAFTIIAIGTSLPELSVTISSARQKKNDLLLGNVIGSNVANMLLVGGITAMINPLGFEGVPTIIAMVGFTLMLLLFMISGKRIVKKEGIVMLLCYIGFMIYLSLNNLV